MKIKWSFIDLDGTLLNKRRAVSEDNLKVLKEFTNNGGNVVISTGRWPVSAIKINNDIEKYSNNKNKYLIAMNGANIFDLQENKLIFERHIDNKIIKDLIQQISNVKVAAWIYSKKGIENRIIYSIKIPIKKIISKFNYGKIIELKEHEIDDDVVYKILLISFHKKLINGAVNWIKNNYADELSIVRINAKTIEITAKDISKGSAIKYLQSLERFNFNETVALGDSLNDYSMFNLCKYSICLNSSETELAKISTTIAKNQNNFSELFKKYIIDFNEYQYKDNCSICINFESWYEPLNNIKINKLTNFENYLISQNNLIIKTSLPNWLAKLNFEPLLLSKNTKFINNMNKNFEDSHIERMKQYLSNNKFKAMIIEYDNNQNLLVYKNKKILNKLLSKKTISLHDFTNTKLIKELDIENDLNKNILNISINQLDILDNKKFTVLKSDSIYHIYAKQELKTNSDNLDTNKVKEFKTKEYKNFNKLLKTIENYLEKQKVE